MPELSVPETIELLHRHGITDFHVWSDKYGLPPAATYAGVELLQTDEPDGWELRRWGQGGKTEWERAYPNEPEACAALLRELLDLAGEPTDKGYPELRALWSHRPWRRNPATRLELQATLAEFRVPRTAYSLVGGRPEGRYCIEERNSGWRVFTVHSGNALAGSTYDTESAAVAQLWRRIVDELLPMLRPPLPLIPDAAPAIDPEQDDLTIPEALQIREKHGLPVNTGVESKRYGISIPSYGASLSDDDDGVWRMYYSERGSTDVIATYDREGDAAAALAGFSGAAYATATSMWTAATHAATPYEQLLFHYRQLPWRHRPTSRDRLSYLLRDCGFPIDTYNLAGGRYEGRLTLEERLHDWRVYSVHNGLRVDQTRHADEPAACAEYWRRAVDYLIPSLIAD